MMFGRALIVDHAKRGRVSELIENSHHDGSAKWHCLELNLQVCKSMHDQCDNRRRRCRRRRLGQVPMHIVDR